MKDKDIRRNSTIHMHNHPNMKTYIYMHICCVNNWADVLSDLLFKIHDSGLYSHIDKIRCCILGDPTTHLHLLKSDPKIEIVDTDPNIHLFEPFTMNRLYNDAKNSSEPFYALYLHTKGIRHYGNNPNVVDWVNYLCYFNIYHYAKCMDVLRANFSTVGVNLHKSPVLHYSGNFWWANSEYIKTLDTCILSSYNAPEFWITEKNTGKYACLWDSIVNHYHMAYPPEKYVGKDIALMAYV
jgi:hypothetical protein